MLRHRLTFGPLLIALFLGVIWLDGALAQRGWPPGAAFTLLMLAVGVLAARELTKIFRARSITTSVRINAAAVCAGLLSSGFTSEQLAGVPASALIGSAAAAVMLLAMIYYSRRHNTDGVVASTAAALLAFVYVGLLGGFLVLILKTFSGAVLVGVVLVTKSCDIGAYFTGRAVGRRKLIPWLSPGKTWEGLAGGVAFSALVGALAAALAADTLTPFPDGLRWWQGAALGAVFGLVGQAGDLVASLLKRDAGMKDYSRALPGFGGVMDIADSPLLVAPVAYWLLAAISPAAAP